MVDMLLYKAKTEGRLQPLQISRRTLTLAFRVSETAVGETRHEGLKLFSKSATSPTMRRRMRQRPYLHREDEDFILVAK